MRQIKTNKGQSLIDIAVQEYGDISGVESLIEDNGIGLCDYIASGTVLEIRDDAINEIVRGTLAERGQMPNSNVSALSGIGLWAVGINFKIQ